MIQGIINRIIVVIIAIISISPSISESIKKAGWNLLESGKVQKELSDQLGLFPVQFTGEEMKQLSNASKATRNKSEFTVGQDFHATRPYFFQVVSGTHEAFAKNISFTGKIDIVNGQLVGTYKFTSPYKKANDAEFKITLKNDDISLHGLLDSVLGESDFVSADNEPMPSASFIHIKNTDEGFVRDTQGKTLHRLNNNIGTYLLMVQQLEGKKIFGQSENDRKALRDRMFDEYLKENSFKLSKDNTLTIDQYISAFNKLRSKILHFFNMGLGDVPVFSEIDVLKLHDGKYYLIRAGN